MKIKLTFGKYTGFKLDDIPEDYLNWLSKQNINKDLKWQIKCALEWKNWKIKK